MILIVIVAVGFILRFYGSWMPDFIDDDTDWILIANSISFDRNNLSFLPFGSGHGPLTAYLIKASSFLFGESAFGWRMLNVFCGTLLVLIIYFLTKIGIGRKEAILAAFLSSTNILFIFFSKYSTDDIFSMFFFALALLCFFSAVKKRSNFWMLLAGAVSGLGFLTKETIALLLPIFVIFVVSSKEYRVWLVKKETYISLLIAIIISSPYLYWLFAHNFYFFLPEVKEGGQWFSFLNFPSCTMYLFLGFPRYFMPRDLTLGYDYIGPVIGVICLSGVAYSLKYLRNDFIRLMQLVFWTFVTCEVLFFKGRPNQFIIMAIPGVILASFLLAKIYGKNIFGRSVVFILLGYFFIYSLAFNMKLNNYYYPMHSQIRLFNAQGQPIKADLNHLAKEFIQLSRPYKPTLIIFPDENLDSIDNFVNAHSGIKTIGTSPENKFLPYRAEDLRRILVMADSSKRLEQYIRWGEKNKYKASRHAGEISFYKERVLPIHILLLVKNLDRTVSTEAINQLINLSIRY